MTLDIQDLTAGYGRKAILRNISVPAIEPGSFVGVIGPNAAGKSTLFKTIAGLIRPLAGEVRLGDRSLAHLSRRDRARAIAYMPQAYGCNALLTVFESVLLALKQTSGWRVREDNLTQVSATLASLRLSHLADRGISDLSGGQAQMVAVAQTLVRAPRMVLLDEPTSALDLHHQLSILGSIRSQMKARGTIVMAALHDLNLAAKFCDRLVLINQGRILADGRPEEVLGLDAIGETYRVTTTLETTRRGSFFVDATLDHHP
ncbi:ABC transporter ATP-binding protein [Roseibium sediminicola]|uniref:ABC transporter ATP-binding protein n=1 Tax=Roseibium sediminicola TaxID=2933272 RepID=A0ABT0GN22_9HYPH|nr:ABC transporter ATP-binding protein [Roseibium sp. CAU 1639]MCK7610821.1 ABC transporter ATP-binding protein [Roseibium sp. CAU 1639]